MSKSTYASNSVLDHMLGTAAWAQPAAVYIGLFNGDPNAGGVEQAGAGYARAQAHFSVATNGQTSNSAVIVFPTPTAVWGPLTHYGVFDAAADGNMLRSAPLSTQISPAAQDIVEYPVGAITVTET